MKKRLFKIVLLVLSLAVLFPMTGFAQSKDILCPICDVSTPLPLKSGWFSPRWRCIEISSPDCSLDRTCAISIQDINVVIPIRINPCEIKVCFIIPPKIFGFEAGEKEVVNICGNQEYCCTFTID